MVLRQEQIDRFLRQVKGVSVGVIGDLILDHYLVGDVERISPEAPVPVLKVTEDRFGLGGAGNVVRNLESLGAFVNVISCIGNDEAGKKIQRFLDPPRITAEILTVPHYQTVQKSRVVAQKHQIVRIDRDPAFGFSFDMSTKEKLAAKLFETFEKTKTFVFSDYGKGLLAQPELGHLFLKAQEKGVSCFLDPKSEDFSQYRGCFAITPNAMEATRATGIRVHDEASAERAMQRIMELTGAEQVYLTRGASGISVFDGALNRCGHFPALAQDVFDVTGAGDTVIATLALCHALQFTAFEAAEFANIAASVVVAQFGAQVCAVEELSARHGELIR